MQLKILKEFIKEEKVIVNNKKIKQYRYYFDPQIGQLNVNYPNDLVAAKLGKDNTIFSDGRIIYQLGIQALPGIKFYINDSDYPVIIGTTGLFEIELSSGMQINKLYFDEGSLQLIADNPSAVLIIDTIEEGGDN